MDQGLLLGGEHSLLAASLDGIRNCSCCENADTVSGMDLDPKEAFILESVGDMVEENRNYKLKQKAFPYFQVQTGIAVSGSKTADFIAYTNEDIHPTSFDPSFWNTVELNVVICTSTPIPKTTTVNTSQMHSCFK